MLDGGEGWHGTWGRGDAMPAVKEVSGNLTIRGGLGLRALANLHGTGCNWGCGQRCWRGDW